MYIYIESYQQSLTAPRALFIKFALSTCFLLVLNHFCCAPKEKIKRVCKFLLVQHTHSHTPHIYIYINIKDIYFCVIVFSQLSKRMKTNHKSENFIK